MFRARVPASSANLGPGFDALGLALDLQLEVTLEEAASDSFSYRGRDSVPETPDNLVHRGFRAAYQRLGLTAPTVALSVVNPIPLARGLGSSSAALVAGAALADAMTNGALGRRGVFELTAALEGHPDNVGPCVFGGFTVAASDETGAFLEAALPVPAGWRFLFGVPAFELSTAEARAALPDSYSRRDVVLTASRAALWVAAVALERPELLRTAALDVIHQPYRASLVPGFTAAITALREAGAYAAFLSGAGPTVGAVVDAAVLPSCRANLEAFVGAGGEVLELGAAAGYVTERY
ncbi:MAG TPA: homoserine kinase [Trueperaceae bacterium]|nr:homoserine kinase [Trueperaceae bacterium]